MSCPGTQFAGVASGTPSVARTGCYLAAGLYLVIGSIPVVGQVTDELAVIPGNVPNLIDLPAGCRFAPRCPAAFARCQTEGPALHSLESGHFASCHLVEAVK